LETPSTTVTSNPWNSSASAGSVAEISDERLQASRLSVSSEDSQEFQSSTPQSKHLLTFTNGLALVIGLQIGSGIFTAPSQVSQHVPSPGMGVLVWFLGGLLVWTGAASFIELGIAIPKNGGIQEYLRYCYGDFLGFLFTWIWVVISKPSAMAMIAMVFSEHFCRAMLPAAWVSLSLSKLVALFGLALITYVNCLGARTGALIANGFLILKLFAVFSIASLGLALVTRGGYEGPSLGSSGWFGEDVTLGERSTWMMLGDYVRAIYGVLFCYGGWEMVS
jgi:solute carrier family 7 (L-type amino acid transporter), member 6